MNYTNTVCTCRKLFYFHIHIYIRTNANTRTFCITGIEFDFWLRACECICVCDVNSLDECLRREQRIDQTKVNGKRASSHCLLVLNFCFQSKTDEKKHTFPRWWNWFFFFICLYLILEIVKKRTYIPHPGWNIGYLLAYGSEMTLAALSLTYYILRVSSKTPMKPL